MFKRMPLKSKRWKIGNVFIFAFISLLFLMQNNAFAADMTFNLVQGLNGISLPFENTGITNAEELCKSIPSCEAVSYWDALTQGFITHQRNSAENNFSVT